MITALLLASAPVATAIDAELAFARDARRIGQWSAFRKWSARDAVMFTPQAVWAKTFLRTMKDPPRAISWRPMQSYVACDGRTAVNTGPWFTQDHRVGGYFMTVWQRTPEGWRWVYDGGVPRVKGSVGKSPRSERASCSTPKTPAPIPAPPPLKPSQALTTPQDNGRGLSADRTLAWDWVVTSAGQRTFRVFLWNGKRYGEVIHAIDPGPKPR